MELVGEGKGRGARKQESVCETLCHRIVMESFKRILYIFLDYVEESLITGCQRVRVNGSSVSRGSGRHQRTSKAYINMHTCFGPIFFSFGKSMLS